jgi:hypothetical protein
MRFTAFRFVIMLHAATGVRVDGEGGVFTKKVVVLGGGVSEEGLKEEFDGNI